MVRLLRFLAPVAGLVLVVWLLRATVFQASGVTVTVTAVERGRVEETVTNSRAGTVKARRRSRLSPEIGGRVTELPFRRGEQVPAGAVVLRLDDSLQRANLEVARRELEAARARADETCLSAARAERDLERNRGLAADGIVSADLLDRLQSAAEGAAAGCRAARLAVERAQAAAELARAELDKTVLRAPFAAVVADLSIEVGEWTTPSPPALPVPAVIDLLDPSSIYVSAPMDEVDSARLEVDQSVRVTLDSYPGQEFRGRLVRVAPYVLDVEQQNRTVEIEVELEDPDLAARLLPGTSADVEVLMASRDDVLRIPTQALIDGRRVLTVDGDRLAERAVEVGLSNWNYTEVVGGLAAGEPVVTSLDRKEVQPGARVEVVERAAG